MLRNTFHDIVGCYVRDAASFVEVLRKYSAIVAGRAALAFLLRDLKVLGREIYVCCRQDVFDQVLEEFRSRFSLTLLPVRGPIARNAKCYWRELRTPEGAYVQVGGFQHPFEGVVWSGTTAGLNFVGADIFGSAYPSLTLNREGLVYPFFTMLREQRIASIMLVGNGFRFAANPWVYLPGRPAENDWERQWGFLESRPCVAEWYLCECQPRFFGDEGCLIDTFDGSLPDEELMYVKREEGGGILVTWWWPGGCPQCYGSLQPYKRAQEYRRGPQHLRHARAEVRWGGRGVYPSGEQ